jgi:hypothetical protein
MASLGVGKIWERQYQHIKLSLLKRGLPLKVAKRIAAATVNRMRRLKGVTKEQKRQQKEEGMIVKTQKGYVVKSEKGKNLGGPYRSKKLAEKRLRQVEFFKHRKKK